MQLRYPSAVWRPVINHSGVMILPIRGMTVHVQQGHGSLFNYFNTPATKVSSHLWLSTAGAWEQYGDFSTKMWAEAAGNPYWISVETEGYDTAPLTGEQIDALAAFYAWGMAEIGWPAQLATSPAGTGIGTHQMGGAAWGGHACPGSIRTAQREAILALSKQLHAALVTAGADRYAGRPTLRVGAGLALTRDVAECQNALNICDRLEDVKAPGRLVPDGVYGLLTQTAVRKFQVRPFGVRGPVVADGVCGPATWAKLGAVLTDMHRTVGV